MSEVVAELNITEPKEKRIFQVFEVAIILKGLNALLEIVLGFLLLFTHVVNNVIHILLQNELLDDPTDFFASHIQGLLSFSPHAEFAAGLYLLAHGVVKVFLVVGLLRKKMWAYPATMAVLSLFIVYQIIRFLSTHSPWLVFLTIFDIFVVWLVWHEYKRFQIKTVA